MDAPLIERVVPHILDVPNRKGTERSPCPPRIKPLVFDSPNYIFIHHLLRRRGAVTTLILGAR